VDGSPLLEHYVVLGLLADHLDELAAAQSEVDLFVVAEDSRVIGVCVLHGTVDIALEHSAADTLSVMGILVVADADALDGFLRIQLESRLFGV
jgi:hypothetical protein